MIRWNDSRWFSYDKALHLVAGFFIDAHFGAVAMIASAIGKEIWDEYDYRRFDYKDLIVTIIGGLISLVIRY